MAYRFPEDEEEHGKQVLPGDECEFLPESDSSGIDYNAHEIPETHEADTLKEFYKNCKKNPGHPGFVPVNEFSREHLPPELETRENIMDVIQDRINRTVRVKVSYTSLNRPNTFPNGTTPYTDAYRRGIVGTRLGTGSTSTLLTSEPIVNKPCPCLECKSSGAVPKMIYSKVTVCTSTHVIYDQQEAEQATFDCFYDSVDDTPGKYKLYGINFGDFAKPTHSQYQSDFCEVECVAHDTDTINKIADTIFTSSPETESDSFSSMYKTGVPGVIVSHPHGCSKRITFGDIVYVTVSLEPGYSTEKPFLLPFGTKCWPNRKDIKSCCKDENQIENIQQGGTEFKAFSPNGDGENRTVKGEKEYPTAGKEITCTPSSVCSDNPLTTASDIDQARLGYDPTNINDSGNTAFQSHLEALRKDGIPYLIELVEPVARIISKKDQSLETVVESILIPSIKQFVMLSVFKEDVDPEEIVQLARSCFKASMEHIRSFNDIPSFVDSISKMTTKDLIETSKKKIHDVAFGSNNQSAFSILSTIDWEALESFISEKRPMMMLIIDTMLNLFHPSPQNSILPGHSSSSSCDIPPESRFILPKEAKFTMRYYKGKPGLFRFPRGTKFVTDDGDELPIPDGSRFESPLFLPTHFNVSYTTDTCPGSSGACVCTDLLFRDAKGLINLTHTSSLQGGKMNCSGNAGNRPYSANDYGLSKILTYLVQTMESTREETSKAEMTELPLD